MNRALAVLVAFAVLAAIAGALMFQPKPARPTQPAALNVNLHVYRRCYAVPTRTWQAGYQFTEAAHDAL